jgi:hypothetical protein
MGVLFRNWDEAAESKAATTKMPVFTVITSGEVAS